MAPANEDSQPHASKQADKRRKSKKKIPDQSDSKSKINHLSNRGSYISAKHSPDSGSASPGSEHQAAAAARPEGNPAPSEPILHFPFSPTFRQRLPWAHRHTRPSGLQSATGHMPMRKKSSPVKRDKKKDKDNRHSHPLNLPPDELRRLSAAMAAQEGARNSMDVDSNGQPASPQAESPATPLKSAPGAFLDHANSTVNGVNGDYKDDKSPAPPPHRVPVPEKPMIDAEAAKAAGNKFFKAKDYARAISEYTKGG